jgi:sulfate adenylyltransferase
MRILPRPYGGTLVDRFAAPLEAAALAERAARLPAVVLDARALADLELIAGGAASPLRGFLGERDLRSVLDRWRLAGGALWPMPVTLAVPAERLAELSPGREIALFAAGGRLRGVITVSDTYVRSPREEARVLFGTDSPAHPGAAEVLARPSGTLGGEISVLPASGDGAASLPRALRASFAERGWSRVAALRPRGLPNRAQAQVARIALGLEEGVVIQPVADDGSSRGPRAAAALEAWHRYAAAALPGDRVLVAPPAAADAGAGGRDVLFQALVARNLGASALLVVRHGDQIRPVDGLPADLDASELGMAIVPFAAEFALPDGDALAAVA